MIHLILQIIGGQRLGMTFLESVGTPFVLMVIVDIINSVLKEESQIPKREKRASQFKAMIPTFFITWPIRFILDSFYITSGFNIPSVFFALAVTVYFIFYTFFYKRVNSETLASKKLLQIKAFNRISFKLIPILWLIGLGSIILYIFQTMGYYSNTSVKILYLGFFWAPSTVLILSIMVYLIYLTLPIKERRSMVVTDRKFTVMVFILAWLGINDLYSIIISNSSSDFEFLWYLAIQVVLISVILYFQVLKKNERWNLIILFADVILNFSFSLYLLSIGNFPYNWWNGLRFIILCIILIGQHISNKVPSKILNQTLIISISISVGFWIFQLGFFQLFWTILRRFVELPYLPQDMRLNILVATLIFTISFILFLKLKILPNAEGESKKNLREILKRRDKILKETENVNEKKVILDVRDLKTYFYTEEGIVRAVEGVSFKIYQGQVLGLVGETGCGKSVTALSIMQLVRAPGKIENGQIMFLGEDLLQKSSTEILNYRGNKITMTFQDPLNSVNPVFKVGQQISEVFLLHKYDELFIEASNNPDESIYSIARKWSINLLREVDIPDPENVYDRYPHELSGGMRQRILIAMGLACSPLLLIADEPTTALDVTIQNQILKLFKDLSKKYNTSMLFITHDLGIISKMCDVVAVMYSGFIVEYGDIKKLFITPYHPYTKGLISSIPVVGKKRKRLETIQGTVPNLIYPPSGCRFHPRCNYCFEQCKNTIPKPIEVEQDYFVACHLFDPELKDFSEKIIQEVEKSNKKSNEVKR